MNQLLLHCQMALERHTMSTFPLLFGGFRQNCGNLWKILSLLLTDPGEYIELLGNHYRVEVHYGILSIKVKWPMSGFGIMWEHDTMWNYCQMPSVYLLNISHELEVMSTWGLSCFVNTTKGNIDLRLQMQSCKDKVQLKTNQLQLYTHTLCK